MGARFTVVCNVPCWAACYFVNGDATGLTGDDMGLILDYKKRLLRSGFRLTCPIDGTRNEFCSRPAFGLACDVEDYWAERVPKTRVVFRKRFCPFECKWVPVAFLPDVPNSRSADGWMLSLDQVRGKCEESCMAYYHALEPCNDPTMHEQLLDRLLELGYRPRVMSRLVGRSKKEKTNDAKATA